MSTIRLMISVLIGTLLIGCGEQQSQSAAATAVTEQEAPAPESSQAAPVARDFEIIITVDEVPEGTRAYILQFPEVEKSSAVDTLSEGTIENGEHRYSGQVKDVGYLMVGLKPADRVNPFAKFKVMLEPGTTRIHYNSDKSWRVEGGPYNQLLVGSYINKPDYWTAKQNTQEVLLKHFEEYKRLGKTTEEAFRQSREIPKPAEEMRRSHLEDILYNHPDPVARLGAYHLLPMIGSSKRMKFLAEIGEDLADHRDYKAALWKAERSALNDAARSKIQIGTVIPDFSAEDLNGNVYHLKDLRKENKYVLVEFWASWCGPCRGEIPHMKTAYKHFNDQGFEILSFSVDDDREEWEKASIEEEMPWPDISDLLAYSGPIPKAFGLTGVPQNYLIEGSSGKIIDIGLRREALDKRLEELLGAE